MSPDAPQFVVQLKCPDTPGILAAATAGLYQGGCDVREAAQFGDPETGLFFVRMQLRARAGTTVQQVQQMLDDAVRRYQFDLRVFDLAARPKMLIAVSQHGHCLHQLLHRWQSGVLPATVAGVVSNHPNFRSLAQWYEVPFHHLPVTADNKAQQEQLLLQLVRDSGAELLVLARYMQILSPDACAQLAGRCINIHHSFLPGFKGARPYHQAHARGVKLIGATAHYVTTDLDEGPIIEQDVRRVTHATSAAEMVEIGRETEASVLARAVRWHLEHRVVLDGQKTVVFQ